MSSCWYFWNSLSWWGFLYCYLDNNNSSYYDQYFHDSYKRIVSFISPVPTLLEVVWRAILLSRLGWGSRSQMYLERLVLHWFQVIDLPFFISWHFSKIQFLVNDLFCFSTFRALTWRQILNNKSEFSIVASLSNLSSNLSKELRLMDFWSPLCWISFIVPQESCRRSSHPYRA